MILLDPFNAFVLALVAGAGWHIGFSAVQTCVNFINLFLTKRAAAKAKREEDARVARIMAAVKQQPAPAEPRVTYVAVRDAAEGMN